MKHTDPNITAEEIFDQPIEVVWDAITNLDHMRQWYFENLPDFKAEVGFTTQFDVSSETRVFPHVWKVTEVITNQKIAYDWSYTTYPGRGLVSFELSKVGDQTKLLLTNEILEDFPSDIPEFKTESCQAGWHYFINQRLKSYLAD